jgi:hypothetical protein
LRPLSEGIFLRSYRLERRLGVGAAGEVWLARDIRGQALALKASHRQGGQEEQAFRREFEQLRTLQIPHVVRVHDMGTDQGFVFFTMDLAEGDPFDRYVQAGSSLASKVRRMSAAGAQVARALSSIHRLGLAHRDIKPANIHVSPDGRATVLDFGTARFGSASDSSSAFVGTVAYMAPEQRIGLPHDGRVDAYALGVVLHEALSGEAANRWKPGRSRPSLLLLGTAVPRALAALVDAMLAFDPNDRPNAEEIEATLLSISGRAQLPPAPWPDPPAWVGDPSRLLNGSAAVVGPPGSGRRRMVQEARWQWYRKGYRSLAATCRPDRAFGAIRSLLREIFRVDDPQVRRDLAGPETPILKALWPELPVPGEARLQLPDPDTAALAIARTLGRVAPVAICLFDADQADMGTAGLIPSLVRHLPEGVHFWATSRRPLHGLRQVSPPLWGPASEREVLPGLLPAGCWPEGPAGHTPLLGVARAWRLLAATRNEPGPGSPPEGPEGDELALLSFLDEAFDTEIAQKLAPNLERLLSDGYLVACGADGVPLPQVGDRRGESTETTDLIARNRSGRLRAPRLRFADPGTRRLSRALAENLPEGRLRIVESLEQLPTNAERLRLRARFALGSGVDRPGLFQALIRAAVEQGSPLELENWLHLQELHSGRSEDWLSEWAGLQARLSREPAQVRREEVLLLAERAKDPEHQGLASLLLVVYDARADRRAEAWALAEREGQRWEATAPRLAALFCRELALLSLNGGAYDAAVEEAHRARSLARIAAGGPNAPLTQTDVDAGTTLSASLVFSGRLQEAAGLCARMAEECAEAGLHRGEGALLANLAITRIFLGDRPGASEAAARCRSVQSRHGDPLVHAINLTTLARLAVELGDRAESASRLDEATTAAQALRLGPQRAECLALGLEFAVQTADPAAARRLLRAAAEEAGAGEMDPWPACLARWRWLVGDLAGALEATRIPRHGHGAAAGRAERARLLLISGAYEEARREGEAAAQDAERAGFRELALFDRLVAGAAAAAEDDVFAPLVRATHDSRWVHLYLGAMHLDAIRRRLRGENVVALLRRLRARSADVGHRLYEALAREDAW